jgi:membrane-bound ClpP family serine protease
MLKKYLALLFGLVFLSFVIVQYNDPDPLTWMVIYGIASVSCFLAAYDKLPHAFLYTIIVLFIAGGIYMWPLKFEGVSIGDGDIKNIEEARESLGLFLGSFVFFSFVMLDKYNLRTRKAAENLQKTKWARL